MNWDDLRFFLALAREGSVSAAGRSLGVRHTTVARRITALEAQLGARLFDRLSDGYAMTQTAENIFDHALAMEARVQTVDREVFGKDAALAGPLKLAVGPQVAEYLLAPNLKAFTDKYPQIDVQLLTSPALVDLAAREADIAIRMTPKPPDYLIGRKVIDLHHGIYGTDRTLKNPSGPVDVILFQGDPERPEWVSKYFPNARVVMRVDDVGPMIAAVRNHVGIGRIPCFMGDSEIEFRRMDAVLTPSTWGVWILSHTDLRDTARVRVCREFLREMLEQQRPLFQGELSKYI